MAELIRGSATQAGMQAGGSLFRWSSAHDWIERARAWDNYLQGKRDKAAADYAAKWEVRRLQAIDEAWSLADALKDRVDKMMSLPLTTTKVDKNGVTHIHPARWSYQTVALISKTVAELRAAALGATNRPIGEYSKAEIKVIRDALAKAIEAEDESPE